MAQKIRNLIRKLVAKATKKQTVVVADDPIVVAARSVC